MLAAVKYRNWWACMFEQAQLSSMVLVCIQQICSGQWKSEFHSIRRVPDALNSNTRLLLVTATEVTGRVM